MFVARISFISLNRCAFISIFLAPCVATTKFTRRPTRFASYSAGRFLDDAHAPLVEDVEAAQANGPRDLFDRVVDVALQIVQPVCNILRPLLHACPLSDQHRDRSDQTRPISLVRTVILFGQTVV